MQLEYVLQAKGAAVLNRRKQIWRKFVGVLACIVVFCTTYALILPAITMSKPLCGLEEHTHGTECYVQVPSETVLHCTTEETDALIVHTHGELCYDASNTLVCSLQEFALHVHGDDCYAVAEHVHVPECYSDGHGELTCPLEEEPAHFHSEECYGRGDTLQCTLTDENHVHDDACYNEVLNCTISETDGHTHGDACYETVQITVCEPEKVLICTEEELELHTHTELCYSGDELVCGLPEVIEHLHGEECFVEAEAVLTCTLEDEAHVHTERCYGKWEQTCTLEEHAHNEACYSDHAADVETAEIWEATLPQLTGVWADDIVAIAESQLGYAESTANFIIEDDRTKGYTRYGAWYGIPYGDWCAMFASFCIDYAGVEGMPLGSGCEAWINVLDEAGLYFPAGTHIPAPGDVVFIDTDGSGDVDHVGIAAEVIPAQDDAKAQLCVIEGNSADMVRKVMYDLGEIRLFGYGVLPITELEKTEIKQVVSMIDSMPSADEIEAGMAAYEDPEGMEAWYTGVVEQVVNTYRAYSALNDVQKAHVTNSDKLLELEYIWSAHILDESIVPTFYCGYIEEHDHTEGTCICTTPIHEHTDACWSTTEPAKLVCEEKVHAAHDSACCLVISHEHTDDCLLEGLYYCNKHVHVHGRECFDDVGKAICGLYPHVHHDYCMEPPLEGVHAQYDATGEYYSLQNPNYASLPMYYQVSSHRLNNGKSNVACYTYVLVPADQVSGAKDKNWAPNLTHWSAKADANYLVAYCAEPYTSTAGGGTQYSSVLVDESRFTSDEQRRRLAGVISHTYPYLTYAEMKAELAEAYANGEISHDIANCTSCTENEYLAASQAAIWSLIDPSNSYSSFADEINTVGSSYYLNPYTGELPGYIGHRGHEEELDSHCNAIKTWLLKQIVPEKLSVASYTYEITEGEYETYNLTVTAQLSRPVITGEEVAFRLVAGEQSSETVILTAPAESFTVNLDGLTEKELVNAEVSVGVSGKQLQAYFFNSENYQDFISGLWEEYNNDISFRVGVGTTDVSVTKVWSDGVPTEITSVSVQLYANGVAYGEPVILSDENNWYFVWEDLMKNDLLDNEIEYTVQEEQISGYYSVVTIGENSEVSIPQWVVTDTFRENGQYLIVGSDGALGVHSFGKDSKPALTWEAVNLINPNTTDSRLIWIASGVNEAGGAMVANQDYSEYPLGINSSNEVIPAGSLEAVASELYYSDQHLYMYNSSGQLRYLTALYDRGEYRTASNAEKAANITIYELQNVSVPASEINYILTNTKIATEAETTSLTVTKEWSGRPDEVYPGEAVVYLTQNGRQYGAPVVLSAENEWTYRWTELPLEDNNGEEFVYSVAEAAADDYEYTVQVTKDENGHSLAVLTNIWSPEELNIALKKTDANNSAKLLPGAEFDLYMVTESELAVAIPGTNVGIKGVKIGTVVTGEDGTAPLTGVASGETYYLVETKAPLGYNKLSDAIGFTVTKRGTLVTLTMLAEKKSMTAESGTTAVITIENHAEYRLPDTGGTGTQLYIWSGLALVTGAAFLLYKQKSCGREVKS